MSAPTQDQPDEQAPKPGEQDTETVAGVPKKAPDSKDGEQSKQDEQSDSSRTPRVGVGSRWRGRHHRSARHRTSRRAVQSARSTLSSPV